MTEVIPQVGGVSADPTVKAVLNWLKTQLGKADQVVEEWHDGANFYRKYSSGFIEQGGLSISDSSADCVVTFPKSFATDDFTVVMTGNGKFSGSAAPFYMQIYSFTRTSFTRHGRMDSNLSERATWYACGY